MTPPASHFLIPLELWSYAFLVFPPNEKVEIWKNPGGCFNDLSRVERGTGEMQRRWWQWEPSKGVMVTAFGAVCSSRAWLRLMSRASCQESTHWSISICFCVSRWPSPLLQVEKNRGVHHPEWVTEWGRKRKGGGGLCTWATESRRKEWAMSFKTISSQPSNHRRCSYGLTLYPPCQAFFHSPPLNHSHEKPHSQKKKIQLCNFVFNLRSFTSAPSP